MSYTTADLLLSIKTRAMIPDNMNSLSDTVLLNMATEELQLELLETIRSAREEFYVTSTLQPIVGNQAEYSIPTRASGLVLRNVQLFDGTNLKNLIPIQREDATKGGVGSPENYYFEHDKVILYPTPADSQPQLKLSYFFRPSKLVKVTDCAKIVAIDRNTNVVTVASIPSVWTTGFIVDFVSTKPPYSNRGVDIEILNVTGTDITVASIPDSLVVGDYVAPQETTPIPQLPQEFQVVLAQKVACKALSALGQLDQLQAAEALLKKMTDAAVKFITPRNEGGLKKIVSNKWSNCYL